ncbi:hypothetical protein [Microbispora sp. NPDC049633]|uniref:hypothetical protein n=1 Tax=Microbispora sp. NPDC049633 TaxID=3154355 RepID=UPI0034348164
MASTEARDDALFNKFVAYFQSIHPRATGPELEGLYGAIDDKAWLETILSKFDTQWSPPSGVERVNLSAFRHSVMALAKVEGLLLHLNVRLETKGIAKRFEGNAYGPVLNVFSVTGGTLYYNDISDLRGSCDLEVNIFHIYTNFNFIRDARIFATYQAAGIPMGGVLWGEGRWQEL